ncbi:low density lipoprotein receptor adapter protein 1-like [Actinia tenebrosa]|uniref:Low density lipoprotein receptor adapter protein 1-like n=1 Tax=Actinia tenebrosa TaxID=6105 RepID=A0A6P8ILJ6_ACTTE|nr:low density lipoprotein receptor adapter protein 1-like [Actinia tenebrosa]
MEQLKTIRRKISVEKEQTSYDLNPSEPLFTARYLGKAVVTENFSPTTGYSLCSSYTEQLLHNKNSGRRPRKIEILISRNISRGLSLSDPSGKVQEDTFQLQNIAFCTTIKKHPKVFTFIAEKDGKLFCHAFLCSKEAKARAICLAVTRAFTVAYDDWSRNKSRLVKKKERKTKEAEIHDVISADQNLNNTQDPDAEEEEDDFREFAKDRLHTQEDLEELENSLDVMELVRGNRSASEGTENSANDENDGHKD